MQKIKIGHRTNFRAKYKCFPQILFPVRAILRSINFRCTDFNTDSADACILVMASVDCARVHLKTFSSLLNPIQTGLFWSICDWGGALLGPPLCISGTNNARVMKFTHNDHLHTKKPHTQF